MDIYELFSRPKNLAFYEKSKKIIPELFCSSLNGLSNSELGKKEPYIAKSSKYSFLYANDFLYNRFELGEEAISQNACYSYLYALKVIKCRFELGEKAISRHPYYAYLYARCVLQDKFPLGEEVILSNPAFND